MADTAWKHPKYPCFCILPLEFEVNIDIHKHENSEIIQTAINLQRKGLGNMLKDLIWPNVQAKYLKQSNITLNEIWLYESDPNSHSTHSEPGGKQWHHSIRGWRNSNGGCHLWFRKWLCAIAETNHEQDLWRQMEWLRGYKGLNVILFNAIRDV